jgi:hypothetical protein
MEVKDIELRLNIKNFKAPKYIHLMTLDAIQSFEGAHPTIIPLLLSSLKMGDPKYSYEKVVELLNTIDQFKNSLEQIKDLVEEHMYKDFSETPEGLGHQYVTPEGGIGVSLVDGEETVVIGQGKEEPKKKPRKKRATKKKATKTEE